MLAGWQVKGVSSRVQNVAVDVGTPTITKGSTESQPETVVVTGAAWVGKGIVNVEIPARGRTFAWTADARSKEVARKTGIVAEAKEHWAIVRAALWC